MGELDEKLENATDAERQAIQEAAEVSVDKLNMLSSIKKVKLDGYTFSIDTDLLDDVEAFEYIDRIENKGQTASIVPLLSFLIGEKAFVAMKAHFTKLDAEAHKDQPDYKPRFRVSALSRVYSAIIEQFDPKG